MRRPANSSALESLRELGAATVYEAQGAFDNGLKPLDPASRLVGPALTVDLRPADNLMLHSALLKAQPGDVLVVDAKGLLEAGPWGDVLTEAAMARGVAGLVIHGAVRDADEIVRIGFPVFCRGLSIKGTGKHQPGQLNVPLCIGDAVVHPGDIVVGDRDGLVMVARDDVERVVASAQAREEKEARLSPCHRKRRLYRGVPGTQRHAAPARSALTRVRQPKNIDWRQHP